MIEIQQKLDYLNSLDIEDDECEINDIIEEIDSLLHDNYSIIAIDNSDIINYTNIKDYIFDLLIARKGKDIEPINICLD